MIVNENGIKLIECPRDAMQGWKTFIPTEQKVAYLNSLLQVGFHTLDFGSFVSPKAIPQMQDTHAVLKKLDLSGTATKLLAIVANTRGAEEAVAYEQITYLGFPLSVSETFQQRNTNASIADALRRVGEIQDLCFRNGKQLVVYISMGFGNPYGDAYSPKLVFQYVDHIVKEGIQIISLADTVGVAEPQQIHEMIRYLFNALPQVEVGVHLHSTVNNWRPKVEAAYMAGCRRFDGALKGIGGCPMANDDLVGNLNTEWLLGYFVEKGVTQSLHQSALKKSLQLADEIFV
jgi:hydroxymethylglutaryl-CoA lyase